MTFRKKEAEPQPETQYQTYDQQLLHNILGELRMQRRTIKAINQTVQLIGVVMLLAIIGSCLFALFGTTLF